MAANYSREGIVYNGLILPSFKPLLENPEARINAIKDLEGRCDDVIITAFPRSGKKLFGCKSCLIVCR